MEGYTKLTGEDNQGARLQVFVSVCLDLSVCAYVWMSVYMCREVSRIPLQIFIYMCVLTDVGEVKSVTEVKQWVFVQSSKSPRVSICSTKSIGVCVPVERRLCLILAQWAG